jgi:hypothetical protein
MDTRKHAVADVSWYFDPSIRRTTALSLSKEPMRHGGCSYHPAVVSALTSQILLGARNASPRYECLWSQQGLRGCHESGSMQQPNAAKNASHLFGGDGEPLGDTGHFLAFAQPYLRDDHLRELFSYLLEVLWPTMPCDQARNVSSIPVERMILDFRMAAMPPWSRAAWANAASCGGNKG